jgi:hypothetical protein
LAQNEVVASGGSHGNRKTSASRSVSPTIIGAPPDWAPNRDTTRLFDIHFNLIDDGLVGQQVFAAEATRLAYMTDEAAEGRDRGLLRCDQSPG